MIDSWKLPLYCQIKTETALNTSTLSTRNISGDIWGGFAAMLVALPSAIAFGVTIFAPLGSQYSAQGAVAGILGVIFLGLIAALFGGTQRLISAPCAPAAAVLSALTIQMSLQGAQPSAILLTLFLVALVSSVVQILFGVLRFGQLIRYMPFPVVSGYLSGVGLVIVVSQMPKLLGVPKGLDWFTTVSTPALWQPVSLLVGAATGAVMLLAGRIPSRVPAVIQGLAAGLLVYWGLAWSQFPALTSLIDNPFIIGSIATGSDGLWSSFTDSWHNLGQAALPHWEQILVPALTLSVLLSIDTLKTCLILDAVSGSRHNANRELIGQGLGNLTATICGGTPGAGTMGASLVNKASGGTTRMSGVFQGLWSLLAFLLLTPLLSWVPVAALAGLLIVIGVKMIDWHSLQLVRSRATILDFCVIISVVVVAKTVSLIAASGLGVALAILMFIREQIHSSAIRSKSYGNALFSKRVRPQAEREALMELGAQNVIFELQGSLFFGTTDQLYSAIEPELEKARHVVLDFQRVQSIDMTAAHMIERLRTMLAEQKSTLILSRIPESLPSGRDLRNYMHELGITRGEHATRLFDDLTDALEWIEDLSLKEAGIQADTAASLRLEEFELFDDMQPATLLALQQCTQHRFYEAGETIFKAGTPGDALMLIARGVVRIDLPLSNGRISHVATFGRGQFFGEMSFLDHHAHSANVEVAADTDLLIIPRPDFDLLSKSDPLMAMHVFSSLARAMADRLRHTNHELRALQEA
jgi:SulP family sulfate permease